MISILNLAFIQLSSVLTNTWLHQVWLVLNLIVTSHTLLSKSLASCDSHLHTNIDLLASWKFFLCVCVWTYMCLSKKCICVCARAFSVKSLMNPGIWFSHSMQPKQSGPWQNTAVKIQLLKREENRPTEQRKSVQYPPILWQQRAPL